MAGITLEQAEAQLAVWLDASTAVAANQSYTINGRSLTRADAEQIRKQIDFWDSKINLLTRKTKTRRSVRFGVKSE